MTVLFNSGAAIVQRRFFDSRSSLPVKVMAIGQGINADLEVGKVLTMGQVANIIAAASPIVPTTADDKNVIRLRPLVLASADVDPGRVFYRVRALAEPKSLEWWHIELPYGAPDWVQHADGIGFSADVLTAPVVPGPNDEGPIFRGGAGVSKPQHYERPDPPVNRPSTPVSPESNDEADATRAADAVNVGTLLR